MALRYFVNGGLNNSWNQTGVQSNWSLTSNGAGGQTVPSASDDVIFDAFSPACTLTGAATCLSFNASTYGTKLWALGTNNISVAAGAFTLGTGMTVSGTGTLIRTAGGNTLTSNGVTWPGSIQFNLNVTNTWGDGWTILGSLTSTNAVTINGTFNFTIGGSLACAQLTSTSTYTLNGTGNLNGAYISCTIIIATAFTITLPTFLTISTGTLLRLTSGTVNVTIGHILRPTGGTFDTDRTSTGGNKISFYDCATINSNTSTLQSNLTITRNFTNPNNFITVGAFTIFLGGSLLSNGQITGAASLEMDGSVSSTVSTGALLINLIINKTGVAVVTFASTLTWGAANKTLTINSAVNFATNSNTLTLSGTPLTIVNNFPASSFFNITTPAITLNINGANIRISNDFRLTGLGATFSGAFGWDCNNLICSTAGPYSITLREGVTYRTRTGVSLTGGTNTNRITMQSSSLTILAIWTLDFGATQSMIYVNGTRIDSSAEQTIWSFGVSAANVSTSINWNPGVPIRTVAYTFVN
jgi:hypothetical protein